MRRLRYAGGIELRILLSTAAILAVLVPLAADARPMTAHDRAPALLPLSIETAHGVHRFRVELARTPAEQEKGLMFRTALPKDGGMLFPMGDAPREATFWMKNTVLPLDLIFIRADGTIAHIARNATPYSTDLIDSGEPVTAVLEIIGGGAEKAGISEGDRVRWKL